MPFFRRHKFIFIVTTILLIGAGLYAELTPPLFLVSGSLLVRRPHSSAQMALRGDTDEESKNRWIWVRDGMGNRESLLAEKPFLALLAEGGVLAPRYLAYLRDRQGDIARGRKLGAQDEDIQAAFVQQLMDQITVDFTGADTFTYEFRVKDRDPVVAKALVSFLMQRASRLFPEKSVEIVREPRVPLGPVWPRKGALIAVALLLGAALGLGWEAWRAYGPHSFA